MMLFTSLYDVEAESRVPAHARNQNVIELPGTWTFDASFGKRFRVSESRAFTFRMDAQNVFNHPQPANPTLDINSATPFGNVATKTNSVRTFQAQLRLNF